ncbi:MAG: hypothetical protein M3156_06820 [Thermoproteota archaeon]|jgi:hypothetical protein|nr:hypothetical protein [Thermoproteota archaeon]
MLHAYRHDNEQFSGYYHPATVTIEPQSTVLSISFGQHNRNEVYYPSDLEVNGALLDNFHPPIIHSFLH